MGPFFSYIMLKETKKDWFPHPTPTEKGIKWSFVYSLDQGLFYVVLCGVHPNKPFCAVVEVFNPL